MTKYEYRLRFSDGRVRKGEVDAEHWAAFRRALLIGASRGRVSEFVVRRIDEYRWSAPESSNFFD